MNLPLSHDPAEFIGTIPVSLSAIAPSPTNPRESFPEAEMAELVESVRQHGVLQPILLRPWPEGYPHPAPRPHYEIVAGERRYRAAKAAGLTSIEGKVRDLDDTEVLEIQIIENLQRAGLHPLEEAIGYERMMADYGYTAETLAEKVGKSKAYIYARIKLTSLCHYARKAFMAGKLNPSTALLVARIPVAALQEKATREIADPDWRGESMGVRAAQRHLQNNFMLRLVNAPFALDDPDLIKEAGSCEHCPKRTGNQPPELFEDVQSADVCIDPDCFRDKRQAHTNRLAAQAQESGKTVIVGKQAEKIMPYATSRIKGDLVSLDEKCHDDDARRTYREIIAATPPADTTLIEDVRTGTFVEAIPKNQLAEALKAAGVHSNLGGTEQSDDEKNAKAERVYRRRLLDLVRKAVVDDMNSNNQGLTKNELTLVTKAVLNNIGWDARRNIVRLWNPDWPKIDHAEADAFTSQIDDLPTISLNLLLLDCALIWETMPNAYTYKKAPQNLLDLANTYHVDPTKVRTPLAAKTQKSPPPPKKAARAAGPVTREDEGEAAKAKQTASTPLKAAPAVKQKRPSAKQTAPASKLKAKEKNGPATLAERKSGKSKKETNEKAVTL